LPRPFVAPPDFGNGDGCLLLRQPKIPTERLKAKFKNIYLLLKLLKRTMWEEEVKGSCCGSRQSIVAILLAKSSRRDHQLFGFRCDRTEEGGGGQKALMGGRGLMLGMLLLMELGSLNC
jgi:hypothetical protein